MEFSLKKRSAWDVFKARAKGLLVPFIAWGLLGIVVVCVLGRAELLNGNMALFLMDPMRVPVWFIWFLFTLFVCSGLLVLSTWLEKRLGLFAFFAVYAVLMAVPFNSFCSLYYVKWFYLFYAAGYFISRYGEALVSRLNNSFVFVTVLFAFGVLAFHWTRDDFIYVNQMNVAWPDVLRVIYRYAAGFLGIAVLSFSAWYLSRTKIAGLLGIMGVYSLDIYLIQRYLVEGIYPKLLERGHVSFMPVVAIILVPLMAAFFVAVCVLFSRYVLRKNMLLNRFLLGNRS
jgi:hypothetical protein